MNVKSIFALAIAAAVMAVPLSVAMDGTASAQGMMQKSGGHGAGPGGPGGAPKAKVFTQQPGPGGHVKALPSGAKKHPMVVKPKHPVAGKHKPPVVLKKHVGPKHKYAHRRWRPGLKWRWIVVPTIILAEDLDWCHYHRYPVNGMHYHKSVRCHRHARWDHPAIRYVEAY